MTQKFVLAEFLAACANVISDQCGVDLASASSFVDDFEWIFANMSSNTTNPAVACLCSGVMIYSYLLGGEGERIRSHRGCKVPATIAGRLNSVAAAMSATPNNKTVAQARENACRARANSKPAQTAA